MTDAANKPDPVAPILQDFRYRPEVDGLRAIAVLAVVFFHAGLGLPGGFVGVDVFYVISGYLITSLIISDLQQGKFTLANFWERRARRIIPALAAVVLSTLVAGWFLLLPKDFAALGKSAMCQSIFGANFHFWIVTHGYFASAADEMPLLHTWSLAVEEQFYLVVPLTLAFIFRFPALRTRRILLILFISGICISLLASVIGVEFRRAAAFYLLPTRAWELLLGSVLAILPNTLALKHRLTREIIAFGGLAGILIPCCFYSGSTPFPGLAALPPCLGTACIVWANSRIEENRAPTTLGGFLATGPVVFVGLISYSLYLWHWPIFAFTKYYSGGKPFTPSQQVLFIALGFLLAILSWRFIETPFRRKVLCARRANMFRFAASLLAASFALGTSILILHGVPQRLPDNLIAALPGNPAEDFLFSKNINASEVDSDKLQAFGSRDLQKPITVLVWGDSHAMSALPAFDALLEKAGLAGRAATYAATAPVIGYYKNDPVGLGKESPLYNDKIITYIKNKKIPHVVLIAFWSAYTSNYTGTLQPALLKTVEKLVSFGVHPWIFLQVPNHPVDYRKILHQQWISPADLNQDAYCRKPDAWNGISNDDISFLEKLKTAGARVIDPRPLFLNPRQDLYLISKDGLILYRDEHHLTKRGAEKLLIPFLEKELLPALINPKRVREVNGDAG